MKVLLLTTHLDKGGIAFYTVNLARYAGKAGVGTRVLSAGGDLEPLLEEEGVPHTRLDIRTKSEFGPKVWKAVPKAVRLVREEGFDLMHAQTRVTQVIAAAVSGLTGVPYAATCHGFFRHSRLSRKVFPCWGNRTIAISESVEEHLTKDLGVPPGRVEMIYNGIDLDRYAGGPPPRYGPLARALGIGDRDVVIGTIGRFSPVKGLRYLVEAFAEVSAKRPDAKLLLVGEGPEKEELAARIRTAGISGRTVMTSGGEPPERYFSMFDIFCMPSVAEGLGLSMIEAMAAGKPCVASDVGGLSELVTDGKDGILVPPGSAKRLGAAISILMEDEGLRRRLSGAARKKAESFSIEDSVARTIEFYKRTVVR